MAPLFGQAFKLGVEHVAASGDHLLLLVLLLVPAPLVATAGRWWMSPNAARRASVVLVRCLVAFLVFQSLGLALGTATAWRPAADLEPLILSACIIAAALHALRPIFPGKEPLLFAVLGLVHGLALFPELCDHIGLARAGALFAFNAGLSVMQLALVVIAVPWLVWLSRTRTFFFFRVACAGSAAIAELIWVARHAMSGEPVHAVARTSNTGVFLLLALAAASAIAIAVRLGRGGPTSGGAVPPAPLESSSL